MLGLGLDLNKNIITDEVTILVNDFEQRVVSDSGVFEAESCLTNILNELNNI
tara:strand:- start:195 stop:350 length:156 start_codon:yes stop_codon:yes gene_type:complete